MAYDENSFMQGIAVGRAMKGVSMLSGGGTGTLVPLSVTANGTYLPSAYSADGFSQVTVDTPSFVWTRHYSFTQLRYFSSIHIEE